MQSLRNSWEALRSSFWFVPALMGLVAAGLSFVLNWLDRSTGPEFAAHLGWVYTGGSEGARGVLSAIAGSVMGVAGTTFSIVIAVLSLTSGQFGPRLLRSFMRDFGNQVVLGTFTSTFLYCLLVLRTIRGTDEITFVPHVSVTVGVVMAVCSVGVLIFFVNHVSESIQVSRLIETVGDEADATMTRLFPESAPSSTGSKLPDRVPGTVHARAIGYVQAIDHASLHELAREHDLLIRLDVRPGDYVLPAMKIVSVWPGVGKHEAALRRTVSCGRDRTTMQDAEFALLQLAEVAVRALSPGINDPFTAVTCVDRITATMCLVAERSWPPDHVQHEKDEPRVFMMPTAASALVHAAYEHIQHAGKDNPMVMARIDAALLTLVKRSTDPQLRGALAAQRRPG